MAAATIAPPPASKPAAGTAPPSGGEIHVTPPAVGSEGNPTIPPPKPGSAKSQMFSEMRKKAGVADPAPAKPKGQTPAPPVPDPTRPGAEPNPVPEPAAPPPEPAPGDPPAPGAPAAAPDPKGKVSPWKLVDQFKERAAKAEARALELEKAVVPEAKRKETEERIAKYEARVKEMEDDLRYHNAEKYDPDIIKANADYTAAWNRAVRELRELTITEGDQTRPISAEDILALVNLPLAQAHEVAKGAFGEFASEVMSHRKEIKTLFENKMAKLEELKKNGGEREKQRKEQWERINGDVTTQIKTNWEKEHEAVLAHEKHGKYFKAREGDEDWNTRLERGYKLFDDAMSGNPADPNLTPDQRAQIIRRHVAIKNRSAAFEAVRFDLERTLVKMGELQKKLDAYEKSTPGAGGTIAPNGAPATGSAKDQMFAALRAKAR